MTYKGHGLYTVPSRWIAPRESLPAYARVHACVHAGPAACSSLPRPHKWQKTTFVEMSGESEGQPFGSQGPSSLGGRRGGGEVGGAGRGGEVGGVDAELRAVESAGSPRGGRCPVSFTRDEN